MWRLLSGRVSRAHHQCKGGCLTPATHWLASAFCSAFLKVTMATWAPPLLCGSTQQNLGTVGKDLMFALKLCFKSWSVSGDYWDQNSVAWLCGLLGKADLIQVAICLVGRKLFILLRKTCKIYTKRSTSGLCHHQQTREERKKKFISMWLFTDEFWGSLCQFYSTP